jgi:hypothetical protein
MKYMRNALKIIIISLTAILLFAWDGFNYIAAAESDNGILIEWQAKNEEDISYYEIYRSRSDSDILTRIGYVTPLGKSASYSFLDNDIFSKPGVSVDFRFNYKVRAVLTNGRFDDSRIVQASLTSLGVRRQTWGSIKAMFR